MNLSQESNSGTWVVGILGPKLNAPSQYFLLYKKSYTHEVKILTKKDHVLFLFLFGRLI